VRTRLPYGKLAQPTRYLVKTFMGARTASYEAALGCRFRCTFCGVAAGSAPGVRPHLPAR
jgi:anaerobic magnesium-protoporphyrin IX monomethyl ester cyclase